MVDGTEDANNMDDVDSNESLAKARELVPNFDELLKKEMAKGKYLTTHEAVNAITREHSREKVGTQWLDGIWLAYEKSKKGKQMAYVLDKDKEVKSVFFGRSLKHVPKKFDPVMVKVNIMRNLLSQTESLEFIKYKTGKTPISDMIDMVASPSMITGKKMYLVAGRVRYVNQVTWDNNQKLKVPKALFERTKEGKIQCNMRIAMADLSSENSMCNITLKKMEHLGVIIGKKPLKIIDHFKSVPSEDKKLEKLKNGMTGRRLLVLGFGSNENPREEGKLSKQPWLSPGEAGFIASYDKIFKGMTPKESTEGIPSEGSDEPEEEKEKAPPRLPTPVRIRIKEMIKERKATKKSLIQYGKKVKVPKESISVFISELIEKGLARVKGEKILPRKPKEKKKHPE